MTIVGAAVVLWVDIVSMPQLATIAVMFAGGLSMRARNTPRDVMVKDAAAPGQIGKVFGFVSARMSLGAAIMPVPYGMLIDAGHPDLVLVLVAGLRWRACCLPAAPAPASRASLSRRRWNRAPLLTAARLAGFAVSR
jgi:hypothetical protein